MERSPPFFRTVYPNRNHVTTHPKSCETQLIMLIDELSKNMQSRKQTDLILLDFSKAFDKVAPEKVLKNSTAMVSEETLYFG